MYPNRTLCEVLEEMRQLIKHLNFSPLPGLIEEAQSLGNRMEASLNDRNDAESYRLERSKLRKAVRKLEEKLNTLQGDVDEKEKLQS